MRDDSAEKQRKQCYEIDRDFFQWWTIDDKSDRSWVLLSALEGCYRVICQPGIDCKSHSDGNPEAIDRAITRLPDKSDTERNRYLGIIDGKSVHIGREAVRRT